MIKAIEIENPYRYRAYTVGRKPFYDIQNGAYESPEYDKVKAINETEYSDYIEYEILFDDDSSVTLTSRQSNLIVHKGFVDD